VVTPKGKVQERYNRLFKPGVEFDPLYHTSGFSHQEILVVTNNPERHIQVATWGLIPKWVKTNEDATKIRNQTINARSETVFEKPSFRSAILKGRCLVPVTGFFEWRTIGKNKYPYLISQKEEEIFSLAGIVEEWLNKDTGELIQSVSILTKVADPLMSIIHNEKLRMPVIVTKEKEEQWIDSTLQKQQIELFFLPKKSLLEARSISKFVTSKSDTNTPEVLKQFAFDGIEEYFDSENLSLKPKDKPKVIQDSLFCE